MTTMEKVRAHSMVIFAKASDTFGDLSEGLQIAS